MNTIAGVKGVEPNLVRAARCLGASEARILWHVVLRAALPQIITGVRVGLGVGWMALVAAELVGANTGLGFLINDARTVLRTDQVIVGMATIGLVGLGIDRAIRGAVRPAHAVVAGDAADEHGHDLRRGQDLPRPRVRGRAGAGARRR